MPSLRDRHWQQRVETSRVGRVLISLAVLTVVASMLISIAPPSLAPPDPVMAANRKFVRATGLHQFWGLFSPPRTEVLEWWARVTFADGGTEIWRLPERDPFIGSLNDYHWQKFMEHAALRGNTDEWPRLWEPLARYVAREVERPGRRPVSVTLVTRRTLNLPIGTDGPDRAEPRVDEYFTLDLDETGE